MTDPQPPVPPVPTPDDASAPPAAPAAAPAYPAYGQPAAPAGGYYAPPTNTLAILALVLGFVVPIGGIICGHIALGQIKRTGEGGHGLALAGLILGYALTALTILVIIAYVVIIALAIGTASTYSTY
jgi:hypothetical protein